MAKAYFYYDVAVEKQAEYLKFVAEELRPFFQSRGARSYDVYRNTNPENVTNFMAEMIFDDLPSMQKTMGLHGKDPEYDALETGEFKGGELAPRIQALFQKKEELQQARVETEEALRYQAVDMANPQ